MDSAYTWECCLVIRDSIFAVHEHYGYGDTPSRARDAALYEAAEFAGERKCSFIILEERYA